MFTYTLFTLAFATALSAGIGVPVLFEPSPGRAQFVARTGGASVVIRADGADLRLGPERERVAVRIAGASASGSAEPGEKLPSVTNYYPGSNPKEWRIGVPHFGQVRYRSIYPGIDLLYYGKDGRLEYDFELAPGADPRKIGLTFEGARSVKLTAAGDLLLSTAHHAVVQKRPVAYQFVNGERTEIAASYRLRGNNAALTLGKYDRSLPLVIDPQIVFSATLFPTGEIKVTADSQGAAYTLYSAESMVSKHSPQGALVYLTVIGTRGLTRLGGFGLDPAGNVHVAGFTQQANFPLVNAFRTQFSGLEATLTRLSPQGTIALSSFVAATGQFAEATVAAGADGSSYVMGILPPFQAFPKVNAQANTSDSNVFVSKVAANGTLAWATLLPAFASGLWEPTNPAITAVTGGVSTAGLLRYIGTSSPPYNKGFFVNGLVEQSGTVSSRFAKIYGSAGTNPVAHAYSVDQPMALSGSGSDTYFLREFSPPGFCYGTQGPTTLLLVRLDSTGAETALRDLSSATAPGCQGPTSLTVNGSGEPIVAATDTVNGGRAAYWQRFSANLSTATGSFYTRISGSGQTSEAIVRHADSAGALYVSVFGVNTQGVFETLDKIVPVGGESGTTNLLPPVPLTAPVHDQGTGQPFRFRWNPVAGAQGYLLEIRRADSGGLGIYFPRDTIENRQVSGGNTAFADAPALATGLYVARVRACGASYSYVDCGPATDWTGFSTNTSWPVIVAPGEGAVLTQSTTNLQWLAFPGAASYALRILRNGTLFASDNLPASVLNAPYSLPSGNYRMTVNGSPVNFRVQLGPVPTGKPTVTSANVSGGNSLTTAFTTVSGADLYLVQVVQPGAGPGGGALTVAAKMVSATPVTLSVPAGAAFVLVKACNADGCGPISDAFPMNAAGPSPSAPVIGVPAAATVVSGPVVTFSWSRVPGDNGSNTTYRLYVQDMSASRPALDVITTNNFWAARFRPGVRYDVLAIANPGPNQVAGPPNGFVVDGPPLNAPTPTQPAYQGVVSLRGTTGQVTIEWLGLDNWQVVEYYLASDGTTPHSFAGQVAGDRTSLTLTAGRRYSGVVRGCQLPNVFGPGFCGPWSDAEGTGVFNFTTVQ